MSPVLLRPIREQFEHDRVIRLLQGRLRRRYAVGINIGDEPDPSAVRIGDLELYPDLVLTSTHGARRLHGVVEVETAESVNRLEAMAEWVPYGKVRGAFYLYVPAGTTDVARRLCEDQQVVVTEIWSYHAVGDQMRFTMTYRSAQASSAARSKAKRAAKAAAGPKKAVGKRAAAKTAATRTQAKTTAGKRRAAGSRPTGRAVKSASKPTATRTGRGATQKTTRASGAAGPTSRRKAVAKTPAGNRPKAKASPRRPGAATRSRKKR